MYDYLLRLRRVQYDTSNNRILQQIHLESHATEQSYTDARELYDIWNIILLVKCFSMAATHVGSTKLSYLSGTGRPKYLSLKNLLLSIEI